MVVLQGTAMSFCLQDDIEGRRVTLNKIRLLFHAIDHKDHFDQLLLLDSDAMMYNFTVDVSTLLSDEYMLTGHHVNQLELKAHLEQKSNNITRNRKSIRHTWNINAGVLLWNLHHNLTRQVAYEWYANSRFAVESNAFDGDQKNLHKVLKAKPERMAAVRSLFFEMAYGHGTIVRHYIRLGVHKDWNDPELLDDRIIRIANAENDICQRYHPVCDTVNRTLYPTN